ncbi:ParB/Srx family N-terminal domain-containing protein [Taklimakanibacter lacteus]|uniref:ParB/Srx family N-terminal domain-containing protein n=1 Tax=Taklimakanibacter lacteus TaxID=2268456 RepID=UPI000E66B2C9
MPRIDYLPLQNLKPWPGNSRRHSRKQIKQLIDSIRRFGFASPVVVDEAGHILAGHGRVRAACELGLAEVPCHRLDHLSESEKRAYVIADNKIALNAAWDRKKLTQELSTLRAEDINFDIGAIGFSISEVDALLDITHSSGGADFDSEQGESPAEVSLRAPPARCAPGDVWLLGPHRLCCSGKLHSPVYEGFGAHAEEMIIVVTPQGAHPDGSSKEPGAWKTDTILAAGAMGRSVLLAEPDLTQCDRILAQWESHSRSKAVRLAGRI